MHIKAITSPWWPILLIVGAGIISACQVGKVPVALDVVRADLGINLTTASWLLSAFALVGAVCGIAAGTLVDRLGARRLVIYGLVAQGLASAAGATAESVFWLLASRSIEGFGFLAVIVAAPALIPSAVPLPYTVRAFAIWSTFMPVGITLASFGSFLLEGGGWRNYWFINAVLLLGYTVLFAAATPGQQQTSSPATHSFFSNIIRTITSKGPSLLAALFALYTACWFAIFGFLPSVMSEQWGLDPSLIGLLTGIAVFVGAVGNLLGGYLLIKGINAVHLLVAAFIGLSACSIGIFAQGVGQAPAFVLCLLFSTIGGLIPSALFNLANTRSRTPALLGTTMGWLMQGNNLGLLVGPIAASLMVSHWGWPAVSVLVAVTAAVSGVLALLLGDGKRNKNRES